MLIWSTGNSPHTAWIHIIDDDSLVNIFYLYRPPIFDEDECDLVRAFGGKIGSANDGGTNSHKFVQRWRNLLLGSAYYLGLCLVCTWGTPVADMLAHSPPPPLILDYQYDDVRHYLTAEEEERIILVQNNVIAFAVSAFGRLFRLCQSSLWLSRTPDSRDSAAVRRSGLGAS